MNAQELIRLAMKGRRAEKRGEALRGCITRAIVVVLVDLIDAWLLMLGIGVLSAHWWPIIPTIGYWWAVVAVALLRGVFSRIPPSKPTGGAA